MPQRRTFSPCARRGRESAVDDVVDRLEHDTAADREPGPEPNRVGAKPCFARRVDPATVTGLLGSPGDSRASGVHATKGNTGVDSLPPTVRRAGIAAGAHLVVEDGQTGPRPSSG